MANDLAIKQSARHCNLPGDLDARVKRDRYLEALKHAAARAQSAAARIAARVSTFQSLRSNSLSNSPPRAASPSGDLRLQPQIALLTPDDSCEDPKLTTTTKRSSTLNVAEERSPPGHLPIVPIAAAQEEDNGKTKLSACGNTSKTRQSLAPELRGSPDTNAAVEKHSWTSGYSLNKNGLAESSQEKPLGTDEDERAHEMEENGYRTMKHGTAVSISRGESEDTQPFQYKPQDEAFQSLNSQAEMSGSEPTFGPGGSVMPTTNLVRVSSHDCFAGKKEVSDSAMQRVNVCKQTLKTAAGREKALRAKKFRAELSALLHVNDDCISASSSTSSSLPSNRLLQGSYKRSKVLDSATGQGSMISNPASLTGASQQHGPGLACPQSNALHARQGRGQLQDTTQAESTQSNLIHYVPSTRRLNMASMLRHREIGSGYYQDGATMKTNGIHSRLRQHFSNELEPSTGWTGASKDVVVVAWNTEGTLFAAGASTDMDDLNIQYNRGNNLLLGDVDQATIMELPNHFIDRPRPETIDHGENSRKDTYNSVDPRLFTTVTDVCFDQINRRMYSASFDRTVKVWDLATKSKPKCVESLQHCGKVEILASSSSNGLLATGQRTHNDSVQIYRLDGEATSSMILVEAFSSARAQKRKSELYPSCLRWGTSYTSNLLLAGYAENKQDEAGREMEGDLFLWDVLAGQSQKITPSSQNVFDICWHPILPLFAAATAPGDTKVLTHRYVTRSVVRTFRPLEIKCCVIQYECPALDINDVRFHPFDDHYISAGCTNGVTYVWDRRMHKNILHELQHDEPIDEMDRSRREHLDAGVGFTAWSQDGLKLLTGSSDGCLKSWDIFRSPADAFINNIAQFDSGIMTGAFSPDYTNLLLGLSKGSVQLLSTDNLPDALVSSPAMKTNTLTYMPSSAPKMSEISGIALANELISSGQLVMHPSYGAGQGPNYQGPYAAVDHPPGRDVATSELLPDIRAYQLDKNERKLGRKAGGVVQEECFRRMYKEARWLGGIRNRKGYDAEESRNVPTQPAQPSAVRLPLDQDQEGEEVKWYEKSDDDEVELFDDENKEDEGDDLVVLGEGMMKQTTAETLGAARACREGNDRSQKRKRQSLKPESRRKQRRKTELEAARARNDFIELD